MLVNLHFMQGYKPDFPPIKLKTGCGEQCIWVLDCLCDCILKLQQFAFKTSVLSIYYCRI